MNQIMTQRQVMGIGIWASGRPSRAEPATGRTFHESQTLERNQEAPLPVGLPPGDSRSGREDERGDRDRLGNAGNAAAAAMTPPITAASAADDTSNRRLRRRTTLRGRRKGQNPFQDPRADSLPRILEPTRAACTTQSFYGPIQSNSTLLYI